MAYFQFGDQAREGASRSAACEVREYHTFGQAFESQVRMLYGEFIWTDDGAALRALAAERELLVQQLERERSARSQNDLLAQQLERERQEREALWREL